VIRYPFENKTQGVDMATLTIHNIDPDIKSAAMEIMKQHGMTAKETIYNAFNSLPQQIQNES
jgi:hypothetical protein